ncbi:hypothetical protein EV122DRAFT_255020 [Schizophyllum commune]
MLSADARRVAAFIRDVPSLVWLAILPRLDAEADLKGHDYSDPAAEQDLLSAIFMLYRFAMNLVASPSAQWLARSTSMRSSLSGPKDALDSRMYTLSELDSRNYASQVSQELTKIEHSQFPSEAPLDASWTKRSSAQDPNEDEAALEAAADGKGKLLPTASHLFKLILLLANVAHARDAPSVVFLPRPSQPLSLICRLIASELLRTAPAKVEQVIDVQVPTFASRTRYLRRRLAVIESQLKDMDKIKREWREEDDAWRVWGCSWCIWGAVARLTFWDYGWFLCQSHEVFYNFVLDHSISSWREALYVSCGLDVERYADLDAEARSLRREISKIAEDYDRDKWDDVVFVCNGWNMVPGPIFHSQSEHERLNKLVGKAKRAAEKSMLGFKTTKDKATTTGKDSKKASNTPAPYAVEEFRHDLPAWVNSYDAVIITYRVLAADLAPRRQDVVYANVVRPRSLLVTCEWNQVVTDEMQMVGDGKTEDMVSLISPRVSYAVSVHTLRVNDVVDSIELWNLIAQPTHAAHFTAFIQGYAVHTTKASVEDKLTISQQTQYVVPVEMGRVERHVYDVTLESILYTLGLDARGATASARWELATAVLRAGIRRLRAACTHLQVGQLQHQQGEKAVKVPSKTMEQVLESMRDQIRKSTMDDRKSKLAQQQDGNSKRECKSVALLAAVLLSARALPTPLVASLHEQREKGEALRRACAAAHAEEAEAEAGPRLARVKDARVGLSLDADNVSDCLIQGETETYLQAYVQLLADKREAMTNERILLAAHDAWEIQFRQAKATCKAAAAARKPDALSRYINYVDDPSSNIEEVDNEKRKELVKDLRERSINSEISDSVASVRWEGMLNDAAAATESELRKLEGRVNINVARQRYLENLGKAGEKDDDDEEEDVSILCRYEFVRGFITPCAPIYCEGCMNMWIARPEGKTCPVCRVPFNPKSLQRFTVNEKRGPAPPLPSKDGQLAPRTRHKIDYNTIVLRNAMKESALGSNPSPVLTIWVSSVLPMYSATMQKDYAVGTENISFAGNDKASGSAKRETTEGDYTMKMNNLIEILFPHVYEALDYLLPEDAMQDVENRREDSGGSGLWRKGARVKDACKQFLKERKRLLYFTNQIRARLEHLQELEHATRMLSILV